METSDLLGRITELVNSRKDPARKGISVDSLSLYYNIDIATLETQARALAGGGYVRYTEGSFEPKNNRRTYGIITLI